MSENTLVVKKYQRKPIYVTAVQVTPENMEAVASWCSGSIVESHEKQTRFIKVRVHNPQRPRQTHAYLGDWVLYSEYYGYKVYTPGAFKNAFDSTPDTRSVEEAMAEIAHTNGIRMDEGSLD